MLEVVKNDIEKEAVHNAVTMLAGINASGVLVVALVHRNTCAIIRATNTQNGRTMIPAVKQPVKKSTPPALSGIGGSLSDDIFVSFHG